MKRRNHKLIDRCGKLSAVLMWVGLFIVVAAQGEADASPEIFPPHYLLKAGIGLAVMLIAAILSNLGEEKEQ